MTQTEARHAKKRAERFKRIKKAKKANAKKSEVNKLIDNKTVWLDPIAQEVRSEFNRISHKKVW
ncbi:MAG: hypothetical protein OEX81_05880 [Candidatus Pacebacteria bacterium]|nr:hypothetical protein [Candidatus Paceibacterota bacterium]